MPMYKITEFMDGIDFSSRWEHDILYTREEFIEILNDIFSEVYDEIQEYIKSPDMDPEDEGRYCYVEDYMGEDFYTKLKERGFRKIEYPIDVRVSIMGDKNIEDAVEESEGKRKINIFTWYN